MNRIAAFGTPSRRAQRTPRLFWCTVGLVAIVALGCGGKAGGEQQSDSGGSSSGSSSSGGSSSGGSSSGGGSDAAPESAVDDAAMDGPWSTVCPQTEPELGANCNEFNIQCEYACGSVSLVCTNGAWSTSVTLPCSPSQASNPVSCPSVAVVSGSPCGPQGVQCAYDGAEACTCSQNLTWYCLPQAGCPYPRPRQGATCSNPALDCVYDGLTSEACVNGIWQAAQGGF